MPRREKEHESEQHEKESLDCPCGRCGARRLGVFGLQRPGRKGGGRTRCVVERRDAVSAPLRSDSQSGQYGEGVCRPRAADARGGGRCAFEGDFDECRRRRPDARTAGGVPAGAGGRAFGAGASDRRRRELSRSESQQQFPGVAGAVGGDGESHRRSPHGLQREDAGLQRRRPPFSGQSGGGNTLVRAETLFRGGRQRCAGARSRLLIRQTTNPDSI